MNVAELGEKSHIMFVKHGVCRGSVPRVHDLRRITVPENSKTSPGESAGPGVWYLHRHLLGC